MSTADEQEVFDDIHDPEWSNDAEDMVDDDSLDKLQKECQGSIYLHTS